MGSSRRIAWAVATMLVLFPAGVAPSPGGRPAAPRQTAAAAEALLQARRLFEALDYEAAVPAFDRVISMLEPAPAGDADRRRLLAAALELRARSCFGLGETARARDDFRRLLELDPAYSLAENVSPRVVALFREVQASTIAQIVLALEPPDAELLLDDVPLAGAAGGIPTRSGPHTLTARRPGYRTATASVTVTAGETLPVTLTLERIAAVVSIVTVPPGTDVFVDGVLRGATPAGALPPTFAEWPAKLNLPAADFSAPLTLTDLPPGSHVITFRCPCYVPVERRIVIDRPADFLLEPARLEPAVASVYVDSPVAATTVYLDGVARGQSPLSLDDVCEGVHTVEVRSAHGRHVERIDVRTGDKITIQGNVRPAFAVIGTTGLPDGYRGPDVREAVERVLAGTRRVAVFAPPDDVVRQALARERLAPGWLAFDRFRRPLGGAAQAMTASARVEISERLARVLSAQGVAEVTVPGGGSGQMLLVLLAAGSAEPDVLELTLDAPQSGGRAVSLLDQERPLFRPTIGAGVVDVMDLEGAVVISLDPKGAAAAAGLAVGDRVVAAGGSPVSDSRALGAALGRCVAGDGFALEWIDRAGARRTGNAVVAVEPCLVAMNDQSLAFNALALAFTFRAATAQGSPVETMVARLNLGVVLMRLGNWARALAEIERVTLPPGTGVSHGTVQYLRGLCLEALGRAGEAEHALQAAAASESLLTEDGPPVRELAGRKPAEPAIRGSR